MFENLIKKARANKVAQPRATNRVARPTTKTTGGIHEVVDSLRGKQIELEKELKSLRRRENELFVELKKEKARIPAIAGNKQKAWKDIESFRASFRKARKELIRLNRADLLPELWKEGLKNARPLWRTYYGHSKALCNASAEIEAIKYEINDLHKKMEIVISKLNEAKRSISSLGFFKIKEVMK